MFTPLHTFFHLPTAHAHPGSSSAASSGLSRPCSVSSHLYTSSEIPILTAYLLRQIPSPEPSSTSPRRPTAPRSSPPRSSRTHSVATLTLARMGRRTTRDTGSAARVSARSLARGTGGASRRGGSLKGTGLVARSESLLSHSCIWHGSSNDLTALPSRWDFKASEETWGVGASATTPSADENFTQQEALEQKPVAAEVVA